MSFKFLPQFAQNGIKVMRPNVSKEYGVSKIFKGKEPMQKVGEVLYAMYGVYSKKRCYHKNALQVIKELASSLLIPRNDTYQAPNGCPPIIKEEYWTICKQTKKDDLVFTL